MAGHRQGHTTVSIDTAAQIIIHMAMLIAVSNSDVQTLCSPSPCAVTYHSALCCFVLLGIQFSQIQQPHNYASLEDRASQKTLLSNSSIAKQEDVRIEIEEQASETTQLLPGGSQLRKGTSSIFTRGRCQIILYAIVVVIYYSSNCLCWLYFRCFSITAKPGSHKI